MAVVIMLLGAVMAFGLGASSSMAQTAGEYTATINGSGTSALEGGAKAMENYQSDTDFRPSGDYGPNPDYKTDFDSSGPLTDSTDYTTSDFGNTTVYAPSDYSGDDFGKMTDYKSDNDYSNPTDAPFSVR